MDFTWDLPALTCALLAGYVSSSTYFTSENCVPQLLSLPWLAPSGPTLYQQLWKSLNQAVAPVQFLEGKVAAVC